MSIKMIASDLDGTFLHDDKTYDYDRFDEQLKEMDKKGIHFVASSGNQVTHMRNTLFAPMIQKGHEISFVSSNGAATFVGSQLIHQSILSKDQLQKVIEWNASNPDNDNNLVVINSLEKTYVSNHATPEHLKRLGVYFNEVIQVEKFADIKEDVIEISFEWEENDPKIGERVRELRDLFEEDLHATGSGFGTIDILADGVNKASGLQYLQDHWNIYDNEVATFGDNQNDLEMLHKYPASFVMPNAEGFMHREIQQQAYADNMHDGVLDTIDAILQGKYDAI